MNAVVLVVGEGILADHVCRELIELAGVSECCQIIRQTDWTTPLPEKADLALVLHDAWHPYMHYKADEVLLSAGVPWMRGFVACGEAVIGPLVRPGVAGCSYCADTRRMMAGQDRVEMWEIEQGLAERGGLERDTWASSIGLLQAAHLITAEARRVLQGSPSRLDGHLYLIHLKTLKATRHFILPDARCPVCGGLPEDSAEGARIKLQPSPKVSPQSFRCRSIEEFRQVLGKDYLDDRTGFLFGKGRDLTTTFTTVTVKLPLVNTDEAAGGRSHSYAEGELTAILEGLERYCGMAPHGKRTVVEDSFRHLGDQALDPRVVGVHGQEQYERSDVACAPFDPDHVMKWVWGYSFLRERPLLVPEALAYYSAGCGHGHVYETSNGCAMGGSLEEAILYGLLEVVERDAFLMTWYAQLPLPRIDPRSIQDVELQLMIERLRVVAGYELHLFNATMEHGIPSVWAVAKNKGRQGPNLVCVAAAHLDPVRAVKGAMHELAGMIGMLDFKMREKREALERMVHDPYEVKEMEDHSLLYSLPQTEERLRFLLEENRPLRAFDDEFAGKQSAHADLTDDLRDLLQVFRRLNLEVIVVDQTTPEMKRNGLHCVKVLIPGMLPMTFGHRHVRVTGLERVLRVPMELGYRMQPLTVEELNPHPHPFP